MRKRGSSNICYDDKMHEESTSSPSNNENFSATSETFKLIPSSFSYCKCQCGRIFLQIADYRKHLTHQHKLVLEYLELECLDRKAFEIFRVNCSSKYGLVLSEEECLDGTKRLVFMCDEYVDKSGTCPSKLNVNQQQNGWLISGFITHGNHDIRPELQPTSSNSVAESPSLPPRILNPKLLKIFDVVKPIEEIKKRPVDPLKRSQKNNPSKIKPKLSLDLFNL